MTTPAALTETATLEQVEAVIPAAELDALDAVGDQRDDARWRAGDMARLWIDDRQLPQNQCLAIIARRTDWGKESIRKFLYCSRFYHENRELRSRFAILRHSVFDHARQCAEPEKVLQAAMDGRLTPSIVKETYPVLMDEVRETYSRIPKPLQPQARTIVETALMKLRELAER